VVESTGGNWGGRIDHPVLPYYGGKWNMSRELVKLITPHEIYVEVFAGAASLFFRKAAVPTEVLNDVDGNIVNFFRVLRDRFEEFHRAVACTPHSRFEFLEARDHLGEGDDVERARKFYTVIIQSFSGTAISWGFSLHCECKFANRLFNRIDALPAIHARLMKTQIEWLDFRRCMEIYDEPEAFLYLDPPYVASTREVSRVYRYEMSDADHRDMLNLARQLCGKVMISGYRSALYDEMLHDWRRLDFKTVCRAAGTGRDIELRTKPPRIESVWLNRRASIGTR